MLNTLYVVKNNEGWQTLSSANKGKKNVVRHLQACQRAQLLSLFEYHSLRCTLT